MKSKEIYSKPEVTVIDIIAEGIIATSQTFSVSGDHDGGAAGARERNFWGK